MTQDLLLAIDQGTQSVRAMLFDLHGELVARHQVHIEPYRAEQPGWAEQDCDYFWENLCRACQGLWLNYPDLKSRVIAASLTTQRPSVVCLDKDFQPLRPPLVAAAQPLGVISKEASRDTGIPEGLTLYASGADKACEVLGSGALTPDTGNLSYGTTATFNTCNPKYVEPMPFVPPYPAALPGHYNSEIIVQRGYWMVNWFKREFAAAEVQEAETLNIAAEQLFDRLLRESPPGAMGLTLQPFWNPGVKYPASAQRLTPQLAPVVTRITVKRWRR